jgi:hypothetical protein
MVIGFASHKLRDTTLLTHRTNARTRPLVVFLRARRASDVAASRWIVFPPVPPLILSGCDCGRSCRAAGCPRICLTRIARGSAEGEKTVKVTVATTSASAIYFGLLPLNEKRRLSRWH